MNLLNPHPYLFWIGIGGPTLLGAWDEGAAPARSRLAHRRGTHNEITTLSQALSQAKGATSDRR